MKPQRSLLPPLLTRRSRWELFVGVAEQCEHSRARTEQFAHVATHRVSPPIPSRGQPPSRRSSHPLRAFWTSSTTHPQHLSHPPRTISHADAPALQKLPDFLARPHQSQLLLRLSFTASHLLATARSAPSDRPAHTAQFDHPHTSCSFGVICAAHANHPVPTDSLGQSWCIYNVPLRRQRQSMRSSRQSSGILDLIYQRSAAS